ncbi:MAG TPA: hypothetical protein VED87_11865 [Methylocystis sp.]|nr:hypothetical protein [Methylocystis sp.]
MGQLLNSNLPDETIESHEERAKAKGHSLETELRELLEAGELFTPHARLAAARCIRTRTKGNAPPLSLDEIREGLE